MIRLDGVTKRYGSDRPAVVAGLTLNLPAGSTTALIGPSGCGKTTTMRMINRMVEPSEGRIEVDGRDISAIAPTELRRRIGYVIQDVGLFPHMTVAQNVATVPRLLGWARPRIEDRVAQMLNLVGLTPADFANRLPHRLSGGQRQRAGVARALAADPPILLMDEPFGAIDPIARAHLQDELKEILARVQKTVVFVTHDMDEAVKMGDLVAVMNEGRLVQFGTPDDILARPADAFVESFVGRDRALKRLGLFKLGEIIQPGVQDAGITLGRETDLRDALAIMAGAGAGSANVTDGDGRVLGHVTRDALLAKARETPARR